MENQDSSVNTEATTVDEINIGPIGNTQTTQQVKSALRCAKCSEDLSSSLPPLRSASTAGFLRIAPQPQGPSKPL
ncbi:83_t:CDS:2, partial [Rhizophagus irregularis]